MIEAPPFMRFVLAAILAVATARANGIRVTNVSLRRHEPALRQVQVVCDLAWENAWRNDVNHDAAWVFVKFRAPDSDIWEHASLSPASADHQAGANGVVAATGDGAGVFVYAANAHTGAVQYVRTRLLWQYGRNGHAFASGAPVTVSVHAIEMVSVPQGPFYLGSGGSESGSFTDGGWVSGPSWPFAVTGETALAVAAAPGSLWGTSASGNNTIGPVGELPAAYPKGFRAFYCMKYPATEQQYAAFLNRLDATQAANRFPNKYGTYGHTIRFDGVGYVTETPDRACGYLRWIDGAAYLDWAGLRPMTELEYEKACRGPAAPVPGECAWGAPGEIYQTGFAGVVGSGEETAVPASANVVRQSTLGSLTRAGIYATAGAGRAAAGASYWGILELSSHPALLQVSAGVARGREFEGSHGDGALSAAGYATNSDWPGYNTTTKVVSGVTGFGFRLAHWNNPASLRPQVSDRDHASTSTTTPHAHHGVRGVRTAP